jgi:signal transduction histidine kinase
MPSRRSPHLAALPALLALVLGLTATAALFLWTSGQEEAMEQLIFERRANFRILTLRQGMEEIVETLNDVNRAVSTFNPVSREQFRQFVEPLSRGNPYPSAISFSRLVPHAGRASYEEAMRRVIPDFAIREIDGHGLRPADARASYLVVEYLEPGAVEGVAALGYDVLSEPYLIRALDHSAETGTVWAAALFRYSDLPRSRPRFVAVKPVYRPGAKAATASERRQAVMGYTSMGMPAEEMIAGILEASGMLRSPGVRMTVYMGEGEADKLAYREPSEPAAQTGSRQSWGADSAWRRQSQKFDIAGIAWRVDVEGQALAPELGRQPGSLLVALFGIIISVMAALSIWALVSRNRRVHQLVAERTAALHAANRRLYADIAARERVEGMLRRTDRTLKNAQRIAHVGSWEIDIDSGIHHWSDECFRIFGLSPSADGVPDLYLLPPATRAMWEAIRVDLMSGGVDSEERCIVRPDGSTRHLLLHAELAGNPVYGRSAAGSVLDISEFKRVETDLRQSQASLRELGEHQERIKESERKRIAREIHDELGGLLTGIKAYVSVASSRVGEHAAAAPLLAEAMAQADTALDTVRRVIADLRPSVLDQLGVWEAIAWQASQLESQTGVPCHCTIAPGLPSLGPDGDAMLFRIVQEALTNIARHANATSVEVRALREGDGLLLEVEDDGIGIAFDYLPDQSTWGLRGMRERAHYLGGALQVGNAGKGGALVSLRLPLKVNLAEEKSRLSYF